MGREPVPTSVRLTQERTVLEVRWSDGLVGRHSVSALRAACPCAACRGHHPDESLNLSPDDFPDIRIEEMYTVGRYAYRIRWSDGHDTGIYQLSYLRRLAAAG